MWDPHHQGLIDSLERVQKFALRLCLRDWNAGYNSLLRSCNLQPLLTEDTNLSCVSSSRSSTVNLTSLELPSFHATWLTTYGFLAHFYFRGHHLSHLLISFRFFHTLKNITKATVNKCLANSNVKSYQFISTQGLVWDVSTDIGPQVLVMGMTGGSFQTSSVIQTFGSSLKSSLGFNFFQEETVCVPPGKRVHVIITTSKVLYQLGYTLEFSVPKTGTVYVTYEEPCFCNLFKCPGTYHTRRSFKTFRTTTRTKYSPTSHRKATCPGLERAAKSTRARP